MAQDETDRRRRRATIRDVAQRAGVSVGTVSHVLNGSKKASEAARLAVESAVTALDYRPNSLARSLIAQRRREVAPERGGRPRLVTVGYVSIDYMVRVGHVPAAGDRMTSRGIEKMLGGPAANVAAFAAGLGPPMDVHVEVVSHLGQDADSAWALEELARHGIDASGTLQQPGGRLSRCIVLVDDQGDRTIVNEPLQVPVDVVSRHLAEGGPGEARSCVHFDGFHIGTAETVQRDLRERGHLLSLHSAGLDPGWTTREGCRALMEMFDLLVFDRQTFGRIAAWAPELSDAPERLFDLFPSARCRHVLQTRGAEGAVLLRAGAPSLHEAAPEVEIADATGAGDAFAGIYLGSWLSQGDPEAALRHAVRGASLSLTALGALGRIVRAGEVGAAAAAAEA